MAEGIIEFAAAGQAVCITPFTLAGAMAPVTLAGALVLQNAELLAGATLVQLVRPGCPTVYGSFTSNVDMRSGSPAFGTPEYTKAAQASGQLARRYGLPFRSSNTTASNTVDAQAAYESGMSLWGAVMGGANLVNHAAGWLEGGLTASFEKLIIDAEMLQMLAGLPRPDRRRRRDAGSRGDRRGRSWRPLLRLAAHDGALRDGVLLAARQRLAQLRVVGTRPDRSTPPSARTASGGNCSPTTRRPRSTRRSTKRSPSSSPTAKNKLRCSERVTRRPAERSSAATLNDRSSPASGRCSTRRCRSAAIVVRADRDESRLVGHDPDHLRCRPSLVGEHAVREPQRRSRSDVTQPSIAGARQLEAEAHGRRREPSDGQARMHCGVGDC